MQVNRIVEAAQGVTRKIGKTVVENKPGASVAKKIIEKSNQFLQGEGYNPGRGAYYFIMGGCVLAPRLLSAREPDEFRETLTRDATTIMTILFAMKALQSGMCSAAQKSSGLTLVKDAVGKNASKLKRLGGYFNPEGGIIPLDSDEIIARYSRFHSKDSLVKGLKTLDGEGGSIAKMFNIESKKGILSRIFPSAKAKETPMLDAAKKVFGDDFATKSNAELISAVENASSETAVQGLEELIGSKAMGVKDGVKEGILNNTDNPVTDFARGISAKFNTISLGITVSLLGFGISKFNELLTMKKRLKEPGLGVPKVKESDLKQPMQIQNSIKASETFKQFI